jgi:hypothetical protein
VQTDKRAADEQPFLSTPKKKQQTIDNFIPQNLSPIAKRRDGIDESLECAYVTDSHHSTGAMDSKLSECDTHQDALDKSWHPSNMTYEESNFDDEEVSSETNEDVDHDAGDEKVGEHQELKFAFVDIEQLEELLAVCRTCSSEAKIISRKKKGAMMTFVCQCAHGHEFTWSTSKCSKGVPLINTLIAAAIFCSGIAYSAFQRFATATSLAFFTEKTYYNQINSYLSPVIQTTWFQMRKEQIDLIKSQPDLLKICGDGKFDSPGVNSAKYCIYTLMTVCGKILDFVVFQKGLAPGEMEGKSFRFVMQRLMNAVGGQKIDLFCSDRSMIVAKLMRTDFPSVKHAFDVSSARKVLRNLFADK